MISPDSLDEIIRIRDECKKINADEWQVGYLEHDDPDLIAICDRLYFLSELLVEIVADPVSRSGEEVQALEEASFELLLAYGLTQCREFSARTPKEDGTVKNWKGWSVERRVKCWSAWMLSHGNPQVDSWEFEAWFTKSGRRNNKARRWKQRSIYHVPITCTAKSFRNRQKE